MQSWINTVLQKTPSSPRTSQSHVALPVTAATVSETTAPGQAGLVRLAAPQPAPTHQRLGDRPSEATLSSPPSRLAPQRCDAAMLDRIEELAVQLKEAKAQNDELHAELVRRHDLQLVIMQGLVHNAMHEKRRENTDEHRLEPELRLAAIMGEKYLGRAQEVAGRPTACSGPKPSLNETFTRPPSLRQASQAHSSVELAGRMQTDREDSGQLSHATTPPQRTQSRPGPDVRTLLPTGEQDGARMHLPRDSILALQSSWTPINARDPAHGGEQAELEPNSIDATEDDLELGSDYDDDEGSSRSRTEDSSPGPSGPSASRPRYSVSRQTYPRYARGPPDRPFHYTRMPRTVAGIWSQWKHGADGNRAIEALEREYGTSWRTGGNRDIKYGSNYVGTRHRIVQYVEARARRERVAPEELCRRLDAHVDRRVQQLLNAIKKDQDPFVVIERR